jgi:hypothetical protein
MHAYAQYCTSTPNLVNVSKREKALEVDFVLKVGLL